MKLNMGCGDGCGAGFDITDMVRNSPTGEWTSFSVNLSCFADAGLKTDSVNTVMQLSTGGAAAISIHSAAIENATAPKACPAKI